MHRSEQPYVVVLAGGEGTRLASLTRALYGVDLPKQFAVLAGERSLLQTTIERAAMLTSYDRILVVVTAHHEAIAREQLAPFPGVELVVQPKNLDTAPGILLPIARILARGWTGQVVFMPSDHYIADPQPLLRALRSTRVLGERVALVGVAPTGPEVEYGWIVRGAAIGGSDAHEVASFREKPVAAVAERLYRSGAVWNTFIQAGTTATYWSLARQYLPDHAAALEAYAAAIGRIDEDVALAAAFERMARASFSHDVLAHAHGLAVCSAEGTGWSDWGTPQRVFASLEGKDSHARLVARIGSTAPALAS
jgi:mannose-1-phosphate guanylyltransferase